MKIFLKHLKGKERAIWDQICSFERESTLVIEKEHW